jgi:hypothetical protein
MPSVDTPGQRPAGFVDTLAGLQRGHDDFAAQPRARYRLRRYLCSARGGGHVGSIRYRMLRP